MASSIIITGASSGIGRATALALSGWDGCLVLSGRSVDRLEETRQLLAGGKAEAAIIPADLQDPGALDSLVAGADDIAPLYGMVLAGGAAVSGTVQDQDPAEWQQQIDINLTSAFRLVHLALGKMIPRRSGHLVFINSVAGLQSFPNSSAYVAAKHGLRGFAEAVRDEVRQHQIKVTSIFPGATATAWWDKQEGDFPLDKMLDANDVGRSVAFALTMEGSAVVENLVIRHQAGDF